MYKRFDPSMAGKGLGLFMVKTQVEALGGIIKIKSKPGVGTEFIIQSPIKNF
jgi:signal transduction histidine kinase